MCGRYVRAFSVATNGFLIAAASLVAEYGTVERVLSSRGAWAQVLLGMWDLPGPVIEPVSPTLAGRVLNH